MRKLIPLLLCVFMSVNLSACAVADAPIASSSSVNADVTTPEPPYTYSPYVLDKFTRDNLGANYALYCKLVDALLNYDSTISGFESESQFIAIWSTLRRDFPPAKKLCADFGTSDTPYTYTDGTVQLQFLLEPVEHGRILDTFAQRIQSDLSILDEEDTEIEKIAKLYRHVRDSRDCEQKSAALYDCIISNQGTGDEMTQYLMLLLNQIDVECYYARGYDDQNVKFWVIAKMGGKYYHFDPALGRFFGNWYWFAIDDQLRRSSVASEWLTAYIAGAGVEGIEGESVVIGDVLTG